MKNISFKQFLDISESLNDDGQIDEGRIADLLKRKTRTQPTAKDIQAEIDRLKALNASDLHKIKASTASREFHQRKASLLKKPMPAKIPQSANTNIEHKPSNELNAAQARAAELRWAKNQ